MSNRCQTTDDSHSQPEIKEDAMDEAAAHEAAEDDDQVDTMVETTEGNDHLKVLLTVGQKLELGEEITQHHGKIAELEAQLSGVKKQIQGEIDTVEGALGKAIGTLRDGYRYDTVEVRVEKDFRTGELRKIRLDTGEIYFSRALTGEERQRHLFAQQHGAGSGADADGEGAEQHADA